MKTSELTSSKYLKKEDFPDPVLVTIRIVTKENVALPNQPKKERGVIYFNEYDKGMVLNTTNLKRAEKACNSDDCDEWAGKKIVVYVDEEIEFGGEIVGGLRLRSARTSAAAREPLSHALHKPKPDDANDKAQMAGRSFEEELASEDPPF